MCCRLTSCARTRVSSLLPPFGVAEKKSFTDDKAQNCITEEFEPFIVTCRRWSIYCALLHLLIRQRPMGERAHQ